MSTSPHRLRGGARRGLGALFALTLVIALLGAIIMVAGCSSGTAHTSKTGANATAGKAPTVGVPDVTGSAQANAVQALIGAGLGAGKISAEQTTAAIPGEVVVQKPLAGTSVKAGTLVDLVIAEAPVKGGPVTVPLIVGLDYKVAATRLTQVGLSYKAFYDNASDQPQGTIISQEPKAGQTVPKGTAVNVTISLSAVPPKK